MNNSRISKDLLPTMDDAGAIAISMSEHLDVREQAFFVAGFQECIKYLRKLSNESNDVLSED